MCRVFDKGTCVQAHSCAECLFILAFARVVEEKFESFKDQYRAIYQNLSCEKSEAFLPGI